MVSDGWMFKMLNRDLSKNRTSYISDAFAVHCQTTPTTTSTEVQDMWYISSEHCYVYSPSKYRILDIAYE